MKSFIICLSILCSTHGISQSITVETGTTANKFDYTCNSSKVFNNTIYVYTFQGNSIAITGFNATTMKKSVSFTTESIDRPVKKPVWFMDNSVVVLHFEKKNQLSILADVYSYDGKLISKDKPMHVFSKLDNNDYRNPSDMVSSNGKFLLLTNLSEEGGFEFALFDNTLKLIQKSNIKFSGENAEGSTQNIILSNAGNIGVFVCKSMENAQFTFLKIDKGAKTLVKVKDLSTGYKAHESKVIITDKGYYIGGIYGTQQSRKILKAQGTQFENTVIGAFGIKLDPETLAIVYEHFTEFSPEQAETYNTEYEKNPNRKGTIAKWGFSRERIFNFAYGFAQLFIDGMAIDKDDNIALALSSVEEPYSDSDKTFMNMIICQFKFNTGGAINNFKIISKRQQTYGTIGDVTYFFSSLVCSGDHLVSFFNDDKKNLSNLTDMNKNISKADKNSWLVCAETKPDGTCKKYALLESDPDILIKTMHTVYIDAKTSYIIGTRDKGNVVLLKVTSL